MPDTHPKGMLNIDNEIKARRMLSGILSRSETVVEKGRIITIKLKALLASDKESIMRMAEKTFDRHFTVAENNLLFQIKSRTGSG